MIKHFLKVFLRTSVRNGAYTFINVGGLAVGLACAILIMLWVWDETHFDAQHVLRDRIYQVKSFHKYPDGNNTIDATSGVLGPAMLELPEVEQSCRLSYTGSRLLIQAGDLSFYEQGVFADTTIFKLFTIPITEGVAFHDDNTMMLSQKLARKYFPEQSAVGKTFRINASRDVVVSGVFEDLPSNSTQQFDFMMPYNVFAKADQFNNEWGAFTNAFTYVLLQPGTDIKGVDQKIKQAFTEPHVWVRWGDNVEMFLFPFSDSRLRNTFNNDGLQEGGRIFYVRIFAMVGTFILLVACINFMNLATARSVSRSKEIGVRKVSGAAKIGLIRQFFSESILLASVAMIVSLVIVQTVLPAFNTLTQKTLEIDFTNPPFALSVVAITLMTGVVAGSYPAFLLSSLKPVIVLKGKFTGTGGKNIRKGLVVFQFSLSTVLIVCAMAAHLQVKYMKDKDLGFDRDNIVYFPASKNINDKLDAFKSEMLNDPKVVSVSEADNNPMRVFGGMVLSDDGWPGKVKGEDIVFTWMQCDADFLPAIGLKFVEGRNFSKDNPGDSMNFIVNEEAVRKMKLKDPIGTKLKAPHYGKIIGIVQDFHTVKLNYEIQPVIIAMTPKADPLVFVKYQPGQAQEALTSVQKVYKTFEPNIPIEYQFMDAPFGDMYQDEILIEKLSLYFTVIAIFISSLGLLGLASFTAESRTKEIGVRKVLGASVLQLVELLGKDFLLLIAFALAIGLPLGWWGVMHFLNTYQFHTEISVWLFIGITVLMVGITLISVGYQSAKAAMANPVKTLRSE